MARKAPGQEVNVAERNLRANGLAPEPPERGRRVLVTGGAGYIGCVLARRLLDRGYRVRVLDRLYWGEEPLRGPGEDRIEPSRS